MRTYPGVRAGLFRDPKERQQVKVIDDMLRQVSGALSKSVFPGQQPPANPIPVTPPPGGGTGVPTPTQGDLLYGLLTGTWTKLPIGGAGQLLTVSGGAPSWQSALSSLPVHDHSNTAQGGNIPETSITDGSLLARVADNEIITGTWTFNTNLQFNTLNEVIKWASSPYATLSVPTVSVNTGWLLPMEPGTLIAKVGLNNSFAQTGSIADTTLITAAADGMFRYSIYVKTTTAGNAGDTVKVTIKHNDGTAQTTDIALWPCTTGAGAIVQSLTHDLGTNNVASFGSAVVYSLSGQTLKFSTTVVKAGSPQYTIIVRLEALS